MNMMGSNTLSMASDPMNALLMKKFGAKEASSCYEKLDLAATEFHKCVPDKVKMECGVSNAPSATTTQPWNVVIANSAGNIHCGGVLICSSWVISTASCLTKLEETVTDFPQIDMYIDITDASNLSIATKLNVKRIVYNPLFTKNYFGRSRLIHDIVAIQIHTLTNMPICLPKLTGENVKIGESIFSLGHGKFGSDLAQKAGNLKLGEFEAVKTSVCTEKYGDIDFSSSVCASLANPAHNFEVCAGDNGGATATYMDAWTLSGLISGGPEDCNLENIVSV
jgi:protein C (activated)